MGGREPGAVRWSCGEWPRLFETTPAIGVLPLLESHLGQAGEQPEALRAGERILAQRRLVGECGGGPVPLLLELLAALHQSRIEKQIKKQVHEPIENPIESGLKRQPAPNQHVAFSGAEWRELALAPETGMRL